MAYEFKITLRDIKEPVIWRTIKVNDSITFHDLHHIIQQVMGWECCHMHQFSPKGYGSYPTLTDYSDDRFESSNRFAVNAKGCFNIAEIKINQYFTAVKDKMIYTYDFGDDWQHEVVLTKITDEIMLHPICIDGHGACPFEDCGGVWGYLDNLEILKNKKHPEYKETISWLGMKDGTKWDADLFDVDRANVRLRGI